MTQSEELGKEKLEEEELANLVDKPKVLTKANATEMLGGLPVQSVDDVTASAGTFLIYGDFGIGKTPLSASAAEVPEMAPVLFLDFEKGLRSIRQYKDDSRVKVLQLGDKRDTKYNGTLQYPTFKSYAWNQLQAVYDDLYDNPIKYKTVVIDTLSEAYNLGMGMLMNQVVDDTKNKMDVPEVPSQREYFIMLDRTRKLVRGFKELGVTVICTAHAKEAIQPNGVPCTVPSFPGQVAIQLPVFFDYVFHFGVREQKDGDNIKQVRYVQTQRTDKVAARARDDLANPLPKYITEPTMTKIYNMTTKDQKA